MVLFLLPSLAFAHGPPAAVTGVASADGTGPVHVALTEGLAVRDELGTWRYVCPATWGSSPINPAASGLTPGEVWLPGTGGLFVAGPDGGVSEAGDAPVIDSLLALSRDDTSILALAVGTTSTRTVWDLAAGGVAVWSGDDPITGIAPWEGGIQLVGPVGGDLLSVVLDGGGAEVSREVLGPADSTNPALRATPSALYLVERSTGLEALTRLPDRQVIGPVVGEVIGPVEVDGVAWVALDGVLHEIDGDTVIPGPDARVVSCLVAIDGAAWACVDHVLLPLDATGALGPEIVGPATVEAPDFTLVEPSALDLCFSQWRVWAGDAGVDPGPAPEPVEEDPGSLVIDEPGCGCHGDGGAAWMVVFAPWVAGRPTRNRKRAATNLTR